jgi:hypothetical protein
MGMSKTKVAAGLQVWIDARKRFHLSHDQVQMARELGMNPRGFGKMANHRQEPWKLPLPQFIEHLYFKRFGKERPDAVVSIEQRTHQLAEKKAARRKEKQKRANVKIGVAFYRPEQWQRLREISTDCADLEKTYEKWLAVSEATRAHFTENGIRFEIVTVDVDELEAWCRQESLPVDGSARSQFVAHLLRSAANNTFKIESEASDSDIPF